MTASPEMRHLRKVIDESLHKRRPDRYTVSDTTNPQADDAPYPDITALLDPDAIGAVDNSWLDDVARDVAHLVPDTEVKTLLARGLVSQIEGNATKRVNGFLREICKTGQLPLGWWGYESDPVAITTNKVINGRKRIKQERVALRAMSPRDFRQFSNEERRRASRDFSARNDTCNGADLLADWMEQAGATGFAAWANSVSPPPTEDLPE